MLGRGEGRLGVLWREEDVRAGRENHGVVWREEDVREGRGEARGSVERGGC